MDNVLQFPGVGTYEYNSRRLLNLVDSMTQMQMWGEIDVIMAAHELYYHDLIDIKWDPKTGEPLFVRKDGVPIDMKRPGDG